jgi:hypothetical protein
MKTFFLTVLLLTTAGPSYGQFMQNNLYVGPIVGYGIGFGYGVTAEYAVTDDVGFSLDLGYQRATKEELYLFTIPRTTTYRLYAGVLTGGYHFLSGQFDPYFRIGVGYFNLRVETNPPSRSFPVLGLSAGAIVSVALQLGLRYYFSPTIAARLSGGFPFLVSCGVDIAI